MLTKSILIASFLLFISSTKLSAAETASYAAQASALWNGFKAKIMSYLAPAEKPPVQQPATKRPDPASRPMESSSSTTAVNIDSPEQKPVLSDSVKFLKETWSNFWSKTFSRSAKEERSVSKLTTGANQGPVDDIVDSSRRSAEPVGLMTEKVQIQPALQPVFQIDRFMSSIQAPVVPPYQTKPLKIATLIGIEGSGMISGQKPRARYVAPKATLNVYTAPAELLRKNTVLSPVRDAVLNSIAIVPNDQLELLKELFTWLLKQDDEALAALHDLGSKTRSRLIQEKAFSYVGWILEQHDLKNLASLALARALDAADDKPDAASYNDAILITLSRITRAAPFTKEAIKASTLERALKLRKLSPDAQGFAEMAQAERFFDKKSFLAARKAAQAVPTKSSWNEQARFLAATSLFASKDSKENQEAAGRELTALFRTVEDPSIFDATAVSLGRIHFMLGNYKAAHQYLSQVTRDTNVFIEAAVDNAWALLRSGDRNHAVGNMFTLHTPYFEGAYMPESYFIRSLGYQESCQFGDAMTAVKLFKSRYNGSFKALLDFNASNKTKDAGYYDDLVAYLGHHEHKMPGIVLRELGRHPEFLRRQKTLNAISREEAKAATLFPRAGHIVVASTQEEMSAVRARYKNEISSFLKSRATLIEDELKFLTANMSLLEYEIFAGAGNNLSLQGAKNFAIDEKKAMPKRDFESGKEYWPYEDEIWEDELNNFRSKMLDGCAQTAKSQAG